MTATAGQDGMVGRIFRRDGAIRADLTAGRDGKGRFSRRDGTGRAGFLSTGWGGKVRREKLSWDDKRQRWTN